MNLTPAIVYGTGATDGEKSVGEFIMEIVEKIVQIIPNMVTKPASVIRRGKDVF